MGPAEEGVGAEKKRGQEKRTEVERWPEVEEGQWVSDHASDICLEASFLASTRHSFTLLCHLLTRPVTE